MRKWWKEAVVYQIYPRSFYDSNGDGIGDLPGIIAKLDYIKYLGVDVIWLCPIYASPNDDNGYDISDYYEIMPEFGNMADFEELLKEAHQRGIKIILDLVVNHTSDEHPWFIESRSSKQNPKRDFYIWRNDRNGREPNNWRSYFAASAWEFNPQSGDYYLHLFSKKQPDLNWHNPQVKDEIFRMMCWWLDKGIDGFRMDVVNMFYKADGFPDAAGTGEYILDDNLYTNQPGIHQLLQEMYDGILSKYDIMTVGETPNVTPEEASLYVDEERHELNMVFQFELMGIDSGDNGKWDLKPWTLKEFSQIITKWQLGLQERGWNSWYFNNHDQPRMVSRFGNDKEYRIESAKMLATLLYTLQGTPFIYQGEEIGMTNVNFDSIIDYQDIETLNAYREMVGNGIPPEKAMRVIQYKSRDNARTPMQWNQEKNAGFTKGEPWLQINSNFLQINVEFALQDPDSILNYYRKLYQLRKRNLVLVYGDFYPVTVGDLRIFSYMRSFHGDKLLIVLNFSGEEIGFHYFESVKLKNWQLLLGNYQVEKKDDMDAIQLKPYEARLYCSMGN